MATSPRADSPSLILSVRSDIARPGMDFPTSVLIENISDTVFAFQMLMVVNRHDLVVFPSDLLVGSCLECSDDACTTLVSVPCSSFVASVSVDGTLLADWQYVQARVVDDTTVRVTAFSDLWSGGAATPIVPNTTGTLIRISSAIACDVPDSLNDRTAIYTFDSSLTRFSNVVAQLIDSTLLDSGAVTVGFNDRGDLNVDNMYDTVDLNALINALFFNGPQGCPSSISDVNCDGIIDAVDLNWFIQLIFFNGPGPPC